MSSTYLIALGSNRPHHLYGSPRAVLAAAMEECAALGTVSARSPIVTSDPMGPAQRRFANAACVLESEYDPPALLAGLKRLESEFGRRTAQRWGDRVVDLDVILWSGGVHSSPALMIPHRDFRARGFVLGPALSIAADWRDPVTGFRIRHLAARLGSNRPR